MAEALKQQTGEAQKTGEIVDIRELYQQRGEKTIAAARQKPEGSAQIQQFKPGQEQAPTTAKNERVLIDDKVDRFGTGVEDARAAAEATKAERKAQIVAALNERSPEGAIQELKSDIAKWEEEIQQIKAEARTESGTKQAEQDRMRIEQAQAKIALLESITPEERKELDRELAADVIVDTYEDGSVDVHEPMPVTTAFADEDFAAEVARREGPIEEETMPVTTAMADEDFAAEMAKTEGQAASGDLDINNPLDTDEWKVREQALAILKGIKGMPKDAIASVERALDSVEEQALREAGVEKYFARTSSAEAAAGPSAKDIEPVQPVQVRPAENRGEAQKNRVELQTEVQEKVAERPTLRQRLRRFAARTLVTFMAMMPLGGEAMTVYAEGGEAQEEMDEDGAAIEATDVSQKLKAATGRVGEAFAEAAATGVATGAAMSELVGDMATDTRYEAGNGSRYDYSEDFDLTEKTGIHAFGGSKVDVWETQDKEQVAASMLDECYRQVETLAATASAYPSVMIKAGLDPSMSAYELDDLMSNQEGGAELQERVYQALEEAFTDANADCEFYIENNKEYSYYMRNRLGDGELSTPENLELGRSLLQRHGAKQVRVKIAVYNELGAIDHYEIADFNAECGWQRNDEIEQAVKKADEAIQQAEQEAEQEETHEEEVHEEETHEEETGEEETGEEETGEEETGEDEGGEDEGGEDEGGEDEGGEDEEGDDEGGEEEGEEETEVAEKNAESEIEHAIEGTTGELTQTEASEEDLTDKTVIEGNNQANVTEGMQADMNASNEEQLQNAQNQQNANNEAEGTTAIVDDDYAAFVDAIERDKAAAAAASTGEGEGEGEGESEGEGQGQGEGEGQGQGQ